MSRAVRLFCYLFAFFLLLNPLTVCSAAQPQADSAGGANTYPEYVQLRNIGLAPGAYEVHELVLKRDAATFTLHSGKVCFLAPVDGKVTGALFVGNGSFVLEPPIAVEKRALAMLTKGDTNFNESFGELLLRFTDKTFEEISKSGVASSTSGGCDSGYVDEIRHALRKTLHHNLDARILQDVLSDEPGGLFTAFVKGRKYSERLIYMLDPHGIDDIGLVWDARAIGTGNYFYSVAPEEVELVTWEPNKEGVWTAFHLSSEYRQGTAKSTQQNAVVRIEHEDLDTQLQGGGRLDVKAATTVVAQANGVRVVPFDLYRTLRVQLVTDSEGKPLSWIQEDKEADAQFAVILPKALKAGERYTIKMVYGGKDAVRDEGNGNYFPVARNNWFPFERWSDYPSFDLVFATPNGMEAVGTGELVQTTNERNQVITHWKTAGGQTVAGFQYGKFKVEEQKVPNLPNFVVYSYANKEEPGFIKEFQGQMEGYCGNRQKCNYENQGQFANLTTTSLAKKAMAEGELSMEIYNDFFGPTGFKRLSMTQQTAMNYGQSWPGLVYLPMTYFFDSTVRNTLGMNFHDRGYFTVVAPHEVAHQWFGHAVTWASYRDQWMSEGFSDFAASLFIQYIWKDPNKYQKFWRDEHELLLEKSNMGVRAIEAGPLSLGTRVENTRTGDWVYRRLIYPKGAYVLQMLRVMMQDPKGGDDKFKEMMRDFIKTYSGKAASTEDFKSVVEKHMAPGMDLARNGKMDWFFDEWVNGTALPDYHLEYSFGDAPNGVLLNAKLTQSNVYDRFAMPVPIYLEFANGKVMRLGSANIVGNSTIPLQVPLSLKEKPKRVFLNYMADVLCTIDGK